MSESNFVGTRGDGAYITGGLADIEATVEQARAMAATTGMTIKFVHTGVLVAVAATSDPTFIQDKWYLAKEGALGDNPTIGPHS